MLFWEFFQTRFMMMTMNCSHSCVKAILFCGKLNSNYWTLFEDENDCSVNLYYYLFTHRCQQSFNLYNCLRKLESAIHHILCGISQT